VEQNQTLEKRRCLIEKINKENIDAAPRTLYSDLVMNKPADLTTLKMPLSVLVPVPLRETIRINAAQKGMAMSRYVQYLIELALADEESKA